MFDDMIFKMLLKEAEKAQPLMSQKLIYKNIFNIFRNDLMYVNGNVLEIGTFKGKTTRFLSILIETLFPDEPSKKTIYN